MRTSSFDGDIFTLRLQAKILEDQKKKLDAVSVKLTKAIEIGELLRDWLTYGCDEDCSELAARLEQLKEPT